MASVETMKFYYMSPDLIYESEQETRPNCVFVYVCGRMLAIMSEQNNKKNVTWHEKTGLMCTQNQTAFLDFQVS